MEPSLISRRLVHDEAPSSLLLEQFDISSVKLVVGPLVVVSGGCVLGVGWWAVLSVGWTFLSRGGVRGGVVEVGVGVRVVQLSALLGD
eukprot:15957998-Heterocapsa_arctica.AAC.1